MENAKNRLVGDDYNCSEVIKVVYKMKITSRSKNEKETYSRYHRSWNYQEKFHLTFELNQDLYKFYKKCLATHLDQLHEGEKIIKCNIFQTKLTTKQIYKKTTFDYKKYITSQSHPLNLQSK